MIHKLYAIMTAAWESSTINSEWKRELVISVWRGKGKLLARKALGHLLLMPIWSQLLKLERPTTPVFLILSHLSTPYSQTRAFQHTLTGPCWSDIPAPAYHLTRLETRAK